MKNWQLFFCSVAMYAVLECDADRDCLYSRLVVVVSKVVVVVVVAATVVIAFSPSKTIT